MLIVPLFSIAGSNMALLFYRVQRIMSDRHAGTAEASIGASPAEATGTPRCLDKGGQRPGALKEPASKVLRTAGMPHKHCASRDAATQPMPIQKLSPLRTSLKQQQPAFLMHHTS